MRHAFGGEGVAHAPRGLHAEGHIHTFDLGFENALDACRGEQGDTVHGATTGESGVDAGDGARSSG